KGSLPRTYLLSPTTSMTSHREGRLLLPARAAARGRGDARLGTLVLVATKLKQLDPVSQDKGPGLEEGDATLVEHSNDGTGSIAGMGCAVDPFWEPHHLGGIRRRALAEVFHCGD
ncbi:unnamed protein product, partial [Musa acuminata subsp. burmannicoides]